MRAVGVMDFAGGFACGVVQSGFDYVAKREPSAFDGFGVPSVEANLRGVQVEVTEPEFWSVVQSDLVFGCPPCSGFSMLSTINTADSKTGKVVNGERVAQRGVDSPDNEWMYRLVDYAAKARPPVVVFESVRSGGVLGAPLMRELWQRLREDTGLDYQLSDVFMNAALVGGDVVRPRYFWVAHLEPFGVDLPRAVPRPLMDVIGDLPGDAPTRLDDGIDPAWGHVTNASRSDERIRLTIEAFRAEGYDWAQGKRLPEHLRAWVEAGHEMPEWWFGRDGKILSHAVSDNMYSPFRWREGKPMGVVTGGFMDRAVHPVEPRLFTYREGARFMGLPDDWSLAPIVQGKKDSWLGKAIPVASGRWIGTWARASLEGSPGEYAGVEVEPGHRIIDVGTPQKVREAERGTDEPWWWPEPVGSRVVYSYGTTWTSDKLELTPVPPSPVPPSSDPDLSESVGARPRRAHRPPSPPRPPRAPRQNSGRDPIPRVDPEVVQALLDELGLKRAQAAGLLGVSVSRVAELTTQGRPRSWLAVDRWDEVQARLRGAP